MSQAKLPVKKEKGIVENKKKQAISLLVILGMIGVTAYFLLRENELPQLFHLIAGVDLRYLLIGALVMFLFFCLEATSIRILLRSFSYPLPFSRCLNYSLIDFYFSSITPGCCGGQPSQIYYMYRDGIHVSSSSLALLLFNLCYHIGMMIIIACSLLIGGRALWSSLGILKYLMIYGAGAQLFLIFAFFAAVFSRRLMPMAVAAVLRVLAKLHIVKNPEAARQKVDAQIQEYQRGAAYMKANPLILLKILGLATLHLLSLYSIPFWIYKAFGLSGSSFLLIVAMQASLTLSFESLPIPGGIGVAESSFLLLFGGVFGSALVLPAMLLCRGLNYYLCLAVSGLVSLVVQSRRPLQIKRKNALPSVEGS